MLHGRRVTILAADGVERVEPARPRHAMEDAGAPTDVVTIDRGEIQARNHVLVDAGTFTVVRLVDIEYFDEVLLLTGGTVTKDKPRMEP